MSRREFRPKRWEQKANVRPGKRARMFRYTQYDVDLSGEVGYLRGTRDTVRRHERGYLSDFEIIEQAQLHDPERVRRLAEAIELGGEEGKRALERLAREWGIFPEGDAEEERGWWSDLPSPDDLDDLAREAGVLSDDEDKALWDSVPPHGSGMVVEIEQWLRDRHRWLDFLREHGDLPDEKDGGA